MQAEFSLWIKITESLANNSPNSLRKWKFEYYQQLIYWIYSNTSFNYTHNFYFLKNDSSPIIYWTVFGLEPNFHTGDEHGTHLELQMSPLCYILFFFPTCVSPTWTKGDSCRLNHHISWQRKLRLSTHFLLTFTYILGLELCHTLGTDCVQIIGHFFSKFIKISKISVSSVLFSKYQSHIVQGWQRLKIKHVGHI